MLDYFRYVVLKKKWIGVLGFLVGGGLFCTLGSTPLDIYFGVALSSMSFVLLILWIKTYLSYMKISTESYDLQDSKMITIRLSEQNFTSEGAASWQQTEWSRVSRIIDTGSFLLLFSGKLPIANLPKQFFSEEQLTFITSHCPISGVSSIRSNQGFFKLFLT